MSSFCMYGKIHLIPNKEDVERDAMEGGYPFIVPSVHLEGVCEDYYPQISFSWSDKSVVVKREKTVIKYTEHDYCELYAEDKDGNKIWVDGRNAPCEGCWDGHYLGDTRPGHSFSTTVYNLDTLTKRVTEYKLTEKEEPMTEYEIGEYADPSNPVIDDNEDNLISAIKNDNEKYLELPDNLKNDIEFNKKLIDRSFGFGFLKFVPDSVKGNKDYILFALSKSGDNLSFFSDMAKDDYDIVFTAVSGCGSSLEYASERLKDDDKIVETAINRTGCAIQFASPRLQQDEHFIRIALLRNCNALNLLPDNIRNNREYTLFAIKYCRSFYDFLKKLPECIRADKEISIAALKHGEHFFNLSDSVKNDRDIAKVAIEQKKGYFCMLPEPFRNDEELARIAISLEPSDISEITDSNLREKLIKEDPYLAFFIR